ncbi:MAG: YqjD family protein [Bdellovibrionales bacterium]
MMNGTSSSLDRTERKAKGKAADLVSDVEDMTYRAGEKVGQVASDAVDRANELVTSSRQYVRENPLKGVGFAAGIGAVLGALTVLAFGRRS